MSIPRVSFGPDGPQVSRVGLGGEGILRTHGQEGEAAPVIEAAIREGLSYFDTAVAYAGSQGYLGARWKARPEERRAVFQTSKSAQRSAQGAWQDLDDSLAALGVDHLDLWQIHDIRTMEDLAAVAGPGGALQAFVEARELGRVRHIGVTGHHDPAVLARAVAEWPVDSVLLPLNPAEACLTGFSDLVLPLAREKGLAVIAMKVLGGGRYLGPGGPGPESLVRFALAQGATLAIVGCKTPREVAALARAGRDGPLDPPECRELIELFRPQAARLAFYRGR